MANPAALPIPVRLQTELLAISQQCDANFTGTSVVVCRSLDHIPYYPMNEGWPLDTNLSLADSLLMLADAESPYHDGFHLLSSNFEFLQVSCCLAPHIPKGVVPNVSFSGRGSRFATAYFMSLLENVICVGIVSNRRQVTVFAQGELFSGGWNLTRPMCQLANNWPKPIPLKEYHIE